MIIFPEKDAEFTVKLSTANESTKLSYTWGSSAGTFVSNYEARSRFHAGREDGRKNVTLFVKVDGLPSHCPNFSSGVYPIAQVLEEHPLDEFGHETGLQLLVRVDSLLAAIQQNPGYNGLIVMQFGEDESRLRRTSRLQDMVAAIQFRKRDLSRLEIVVVETPSTAPHTVLWIAPPGVLPQNIRGQQFTVYKAEDLIKNPQKAIEMTLCRCK